MKTESISASLRALERDFQQLARSAERTSRAPADESVDLTAERLEQLKVQRDAQAQLVALRTADEMLGLVIDLKA
ncbi:MAG: hypothetical protein CVV27_02230 [Candidatus Melainabacteria bacterium HGW-Melainabacteria-1]|nr:MAG: hypothetical protein CVV27_02230 [Candidatus Melainabacteria bacterium HGW-Melainabacteria-1]